MSVSPSWWILPATAVPLTILVLILWFSWYRRRHLELNRTCTVHVSKHLPKKRSKGLYGLGGIIDFKTPSSLMWLIGDSDSGNLQVT